MGPAGLLGGRCRYKSASSAEAPLASWTSVPSGRTGAGLNRQLRRWLATERQGLRWSSRRARPSHELQPRPGPRDLVDQDADVAPVPRAAVGRVGQPDLGVARAHAASYAPDAGPVERGPAGRVADRLDDLPALLLAMAASSGQASARAARSP